MICERIVKHKYLRYLNVLKIYEVFGRQKKYYQILKISEDASQGEIKFAFYKLAKQYHPDKKKHHEEKFKDINDAYRILSNSETRRKYDTTKYQHDHSNQQKSDQSYYQTTNKSYYAHSKEEWAKYRAGYRNINYSNTIETQIYHKNLNNNQNTRQKWIDYHQKLRQYQNKRMTQHDEHKIQNKQIKQSTQWKIFFSIYLTSWKYFNLKFKFKQFINQYIKK